MNGLSLRQEAALAIAWTHQNEDRSDFTNLGLSGEFVSLRDMGMLRITTDWGHKLVLFQGMERAGLEHYDQTRKARRRFEAISDDADALILALAVQNEERRSTSDATPQVSGDLASVPIYQELSQHDLLDVKWADNKPFIVRVTAKGRSYAEGWFQDQMNDNPLSVSIAPIFNNNGAATAFASATIQDVTLGQTIGAIVGLGINEGIKSEAQDAVRQLDSAAKCKDSVAFGEKLENVARVIKSGSSGFLVGSTG